MNEQSTGIIVVGAGLAGLCAALAAHEAGGQVVVIEAASRERRGGNSTFSNGSFRVAHDGLGHGGEKDLSLLIADRPHRHDAEVRVAGYSADAFAADVRTTARGRSDERELARVVDESFDAMRWLAEHGVRFELNLKFVDAESLTSDTFDLDPGVGLAASGGGIGLMDSMFAAVEAAGIRVRYDTALDDLIVMDGAVVGVRVITEHGAQDLYGTVVLATGGFEANPEMRRKYLGEGWDLVPVRGSEFNTGRGLVAALGAGAVAGGHWGGCHAVPTDADIPLIGDLVLSARSERYAYANGILINEDGRRFIDEGEDAFPMTYTKVGAAICAQPGSTAYQVFDANASGSLHDHYLTHGNPLVADSVEELARLLEVRQDELVRTIDDYNAACRSAADAGEAGRSAPVGQPPKSQWAEPLERAPFSAYKVTAAISFTYGGIIADQAMTVQRSGGHPLAGLHAAGGIVGGLFYFNYPAAASLTRAAVTGRIAGRNAALAVLSAPVGALARN